MGRDLTGQILKSPRAAWRAYARAHGLNPNGVILYRGPSPIDGTPIVAVATGLVDGSENSKTGAMVQIYILVDGWHPIDAVNAGVDAAICGDCPHSKDPDTGKRSCYVNLMQGPRAVASCLDRGRYAEGPTAVAMALELMRDRPIRFGTYGDPAMVPARVWVPILAVAGVWTGYTHQWRREFAADVGAFLMASVDSEGEARDARELGLRTFRVRPRGAPLLPWEIDCPSARGVLCEDCGLCSGNATRARCISIEVHGNGARAFEEVVQIGR